MAELFTGKPPGCKKVPEIFIVERTGNPNYDGWYTHEIAFKAARRASFIELPPMDDGTPHSQIRFVNRNTQSGLVYFIAFFPSKGAWVLCELLPDGSAG